MLVYQKTMFALVTVLGMDIIQKVYFGRAYCNSSYINIDTCNTIRFN